MEKTILLTGGAGYVGSHTNKHLSRLGFRTIVLDSLERGHKEFVKWGEFIEGNVGDKLLLNNIFASYEVDAILHCAAYAYVGESAVEPEKYWRNNVENTLRLLEVSIEHGVNKFVLSSTCATYGLPLEIPISENHKQDPISPYGSGKFAIELMLKDFAAAYDIDYFILRYFNAAGADPDGELGENHLPETHLIPKLLNGIKEDCPKITIYGIDYPTTDGTCVRDYIHVTDIAHGHYCALQFLFENRGQSNICNLGLGRGFSVKEVIASVERVTGHHVKVSVVPRRVGDPPILIADTTSAKIILEWSPRFQSLDAIVGSAWEWHRKN